MIKKFYYKASRDIIVSSIFSIIYFLFISSILNSGLLVDKVLNVEIIKLLCICSVIFIIVIFILCIYSNTFNCLIIKPNEIIYKTGWISKKTISIPSNKIRSCSKSSGILQRACRTSSISITTAGDSSEIIFYNIENGETAYQMICQLSQNN